jgi:hypothetical protein
MSEKKQDSFTVTDRRLFTSDGELRKEVSEEEIATSKPAPVAPPPPQSAETTSPEQSAGTLDSSVPPPPKNRPMHTASRQKSLTPGSNSAATPPKKWR